MVPVSIVNAINRAAIPLTFDSGDYDPLLERAIGVIYRPETERLSHYLHSRMTGQFDAVIHIDRTMALIPFERTSAWEAGEVPETYHSRCEALGFFLRPAAVWKASSQEALSIL